MTRRGSSADASDVRQVVTEIQALARQLRRTERLWTTAEAFDYLAEIEHASDVALGLLARLEIGRLRRPAKRSSDQPAARAASTPSD